MAAQGEIDVFGKLVAQTVAGKICNAEQVDGLEEMIAGAIQPAPDKEVITVLTYNDEAPADPDDGDLYINSDENKLYSYNETNDEWVEETPSQETVYITKDTSHFYVYNGITFVDETGIPVDDTIYVTNTTTDLEPYTTKGIYTVCQNRAGLVSYYTLVVSQVRRSRGRIITITITQTLTFKDGYSQRSKTGDEAWTAWKTYDNVYKDSTATQGNLAMFDEEGGIEDSEISVTGLLARLDELEGLAGAGMVL
jgi:hypothetical protein